MLDPRAAADEGAGLEMIAGRITAAGKKPLQAHQPFARCLGRGVEADRLLAAMLDHDVGMVVEIGSDAGQIVADVDVQPSQVIRWADARKLEQLRRVEGAAAQDDLAFGADFQSLAIAQIAHAGGAPALELDRERQCARHDGEVRPPRSRRQISPRHAPAPATPRRAIIRSESLLLPGVDIGRVGISRLDAGVNEGIGQRRSLDPGRGDRQRTVSAVIRVATFFMGLGALEIGQQLGIGPAAEPLLGPIVVVAGVAADIHHAVDGGGAADDAAPGMAETPVVQERFGLRDIGPVETLGG